MSNIDFDDDLDEVLPWDVELEVVDEDFDNIEESETEHYGEAFLSFLDPLDDIPPEFIEGRLSQALEEYTLDELLMENEMEESEAVGILYELGYIGLPEFIENEDEEVQDREETEDE